jgi:hypothetical protein
LFSSPSFNQFGETWLQMDGLAETRKNDNQERVRTNSQNNEHNQPMTKTGYSTSDRGEIE